MVGPSDTNCVQVEHWVNDIFFQVDNLPLCLAVNKGRAKSKHLFKTLNQVAAYSLATGCPTKLRWVPSELNPSDAPSRNKDNIIQQTNFINIDPQYLNNLAQTILPGKDDTVGCGIR